MTRDEVLDLLRTHKEALADRFGVTGLALYGSFAREGVCSRDQEAGDVENQKQGRCGDGPQHAQTMAGDLSSANEHPPGGEQDSTGEV